MTPLFEDRKVYSTDCRSVSLSCWKIGVQPKLYAIYNGSTSLQCEVGNEEVKKLIVLQRVALVKYIYILCLGVRLYFCILN